MSSAKAKKKTAKTLKHLKNKPLVPKWKLFRAKEPLLSTFMWGVNHSLSELCHVPPPRLLMPDDFKAYSKIKVDNHGFNKDNMPGHFKFKEYCPNVFRNLRDRFGVSDGEYLHRLTKHEPFHTDNSRVMLSFDEALCVKTLHSESTAELLHALPRYHEYSLTAAEPNNTDSPGRSGARFFVSHDDRFLIKALTAEEVAEVHQIMSKYHEYVVEKHGKTLLPQYLGMYRLTLNGQETYLTVMRNIFGRRYPVHKKYDLKGSSVAREASEKERAKELPTFKDNDFVKDNVKLHLPADSRQKLIDMLSDDTAFLSKLHLMDYSLLVGIHDCDRAAEEALQADQEEITDRLGGALLEASEDSDGCASEEEEKVSTQPTPPDSPIPSTGAFAPFHQDSGLELDREFYAITSPLGAPKREIYFIGLVDILTYYGVKKRTASAAKSVKYGEQADQISTVRPDQYAKRLVDFVQTSVVTA